MLRASARCRLYRPHPSRAWLKTYASKYEPRPADDESSLWTKAVTVRIREGIPPLTLGNGKIAALAHGSSVGQHGDSVVFATVVSDRNPQAAGEGDGGMPFQVEYREKPHASGQIPGSPNRREITNGESEILTGRLVDRCLRPLFPPLYASETQLTTTVQSFETCQQPGGFAAASSPASLATNVSSAALLLSDLPWPGPVACVRVGMVGGKLVAEPTQAEMATSNLDLLYAATADRTLMIELSAAKEPVSETELKMALRFAHEATGPILQAQNDLLERVGAQHKRPETPIDSDQLTSLRARASEVDGGEAKAIFGNRELSRGQRAQSEAKLMKRLEDDLSEYADAVPASVLTEVCHEQLWLGMRAALLDGEADGRKGSERCDGRDLSALRQLTAAAGVLPDTVHGSSLFSRGATQVLCTATLGGSLDAARPLGRMPLSGGLAVHRPDLVPRKRHFLHYEFPPYCTGEVGKLGPPNRRALGHGNLAEKAITAVLPSFQEFPYTVRLSCEVTSSNGSSSMASACAASLALLDAGVPISAPVAGVSIGLVTDTCKETGTILRHELLTDILGLEDHYGDMDFKVAGTASGVTAVQLDVKLEGGVPLSIIEEAIDRAVEARLQILGVMETARPQKTTPLTIKASAPRAAVVKFKRSRLRDLMGAGGETKRALEVAYECVLDIEDVVPEGGGRSYSPSFGSGVIGVGRDPNDGDEPMMQVTVLAPGVSACDAAESHIQELVLDVEAGQILKGVVTEVRDFGAILEVLRGRQGLLHISEITHSLEGRASSELLSVGQKLLVKCIGVDPLTGYVRLSRKVILDPTMTDPSIMMTSSNNNTKKGSRSQSPSASSSAAARNKKGKNNNNGPHARGTTTNNGGGTTISSQNQPPRGRASASASAQPNGRRGSGASKKPSVSPNRRPPPQQQQQQQQQQRRSSGVRRAGGDGTAGDAAGDRPPSKLGPPTRNQAQAGRGGVKPKRRDDSSKQLGEYNRGHKNNNNNNNNNAGSKRRRPPHQRKSQHKEPLKEGNRSTGTPETPSPETSKQPKKEGPMSRLLGWLGGS